MACNGVLTPPPTAKLIFPKNGNPPPVLKFFNPPPPVIKIFNSPQSFNFLLPLNKTKQKEGKKKKFEEI